MQRNITTPRIEEELSVQESPDDCTCDECGTRFQKPLLATFTSQGSSEEYYACPRCLTKVAETETKQRRENEETPSAVRLGKVGTLLEGDVKCEHFMGYLKKRPKDTPIPDECLTCTKMVECLYIQ
jgi:hypothetical protein